MKDYMREIVDLTGDAYLNPVPAVYDNGTHIRDVGQIKSISIHHDATPRPHDYDSVARYRQEAAQHYERLGPGLQYHFKIDNTGVIFKTRPLETWLYAVGSDENPTNLAICLDGYFHPPYNEKPTREQYEALGQLLVILCEQHPEFPATYPDVRPHRDFSSTACPGDLLSPWVYAIQSKEDVLNIPADAIYDWPEFQPHLTEPISSPAIPDTSHDQSVPPVSDSTPIPVTVVPPPAPRATPEPAPTTEPVAPILPPVIKVQPMNNIKRVMFSKKFLLALLAVGTFLLNGQFDQALTVALAYIGVQGAIDHKNTAAGAGAQL